ncbi:hypothetical protein NHX12_012511 [Muraenolepis orangiensis]|uniref:Protein lifeguard 2 n=1 Tax=Muraenolepis orangiensis TaxID=630683 RepID=A0A9Q0DCL0_9TELE|nr:hypothetical protein NHX12_012511 [Muraenolepis orangiensis]
MTQGKLLLATKTTNGPSTGEGQGPSAPPSYEEAIAGVSSPCYSDSERLTEFTWEDKNIRRIFIRKVYAILMIQLFVTMAIVAIFTFCFYNTKSVVLCLGITAVVCLIVTIFSFQTKYDVTSCGGVLFIFSMVMFISGLVMALVLPYHYFLAFDTQLLMGNKRYAMSPEEYIYATLCIYLDIVYIFSFFLQIFGTKRE